MPHPPAQISFFLRRDRIIEALDRAHLEQSQCAAELEISRPYWSRLLNGHQRLSPKMRRKILAHPVLGKQAEADLWEVRRPAAASATPA